ncbi:hypothetical protein C1645_826750 [Glomus cerebriforme]|uniref:Uncharacterized protein n=1 Tax=Glomus cerebriforme TaxID=658196 RepID=A0A397SU90_9GLOM|nr:hypothetical protein C1645_826750 [Glomus cerebriforme]
MTEPDDYKIGREPSSAVVFHALPKHDEDIIIEKTDDNKERWQDREHVVHPPLMKNDPKGIVGHVEKDWEKEVKEGKHKVDQKDSKPK